MIAVVPVRAGRLPVGGAETVAEAGGRALLVGDGTAEAALELTGVATEVRTWEQAGFAPAAWAAALAPVLADELVVLLPNGADGRDLAPRLAHRLDRPLLAGSVAVRAAGATVARQGGLLMEDIVVEGPFVATLQPGVRGAEVEPSLGAVPPEQIRPGPGSEELRDPEVIEVIPPDPATMDLSEAPRIVGGGAGLGSKATMDVLVRVADALGCSTGGTRVVTDWGWLPFERQIGTTGVTVDPDLYLAFGISGAVQHVAGLGDPAHVISVNLDASSPMMSLADLALVTDGPALVAELARRLGVDEQPGADRA
ncbi:MAG TPA: mycofactocin-associated electron transfer flavoprotein alpha subunit [Acidimicrobiales bacterium]